MSEFVIDNVRKYLHEFLPEMGLTLFDVQFRQEAHGWVLRVYIDTVSDMRGVSLEQCSDVSRVLGQYLDVEDCIAHPYHLEVSSPGLDRPLRSPADFARYQGRLCKIRLHHPVNGEKVHVGEIVAVTGDDITLNGEQGELQITWEMVNKARLFF